MRSCPRQIHIRMLKGIGIGYSNKDDTPLLYRTWFMTMLLIIWVACLVVLSVA